MGGLPPLPTLPVFVVGVKMALVEGGVVENDLLPIIIALVRRPFILTTNAGTKTSNTRKEMLYRWCESL